MGLKSESLVIIICYQARLIITFLEAIFLGVLQGVTEFLPVSSSGHLVLLKNMFGLTEPDLFFDTMVHCGTLAAVLVVFRDDLRRLFVGFLRLRQGLNASREEKAFLSSDPQIRMIGFIALASLPTGFIGFFFKDFFERLFASVFAVGTCLMVTATLLLLTRIARRNAGEERTMAWIDALVIGCVQGLAIAPGISRSGSTIAAALLLGIDRDTAGRFSFLIFVPAILGAIVLNAKLPDSHALSYLSTISAATAAAAFTGYGALKLLLRFVRQGKLFVFAPYCYALGALAMVLAR